MLKGLSKKTDIQRVFKKGKRYPASFGWVYLCERNNGRSTVTVLARKKLGTAVKRNRARRLIKEAFRQINPEQSFDIIVRLNTVELDFHQAYQELKRIIEKHGKNSCQGN